MSLTEKKPRRYRVLLHVAVIIGCLFALGAESTGTGLHTFEFAPFSLLSDGSFSTIELLGLFGALATSIFALVYAYLLGKKVFAAEQGTEGMRAIAQAVRDGSNAYLKRQFTTVGVMVVFLFGVIVLTGWSWGKTGSEAEEIRLVAISRGVAFLVGSVFSALVGFFGMRLATAGNLRVAAAARKSFALSMKLGYQTGTVTGMLTTGLGLLGGTLIVLVMGDKAPLTLLGFAFGGSLLALFMRVGGGIYTKAADVGADLVGKVEQNIPEDDPRNAATIADNVGDNVGDCAGMAADVFESYTVTMVAAMILGSAAFGTKAMLLPLLIQTIGILASAFSTTLVGKKDAAGASGAMKTINLSFRVGAGLTTIGVLGLGLAYCRFDQPYIVTQAVERGVYKLTEFREGVGLPKDFTASDHEAHQSLKAWKALDQEKKTAISLKPIAKDTDGLPVTTATTIFQEADRLVPVNEGLDMRPIWACLVGIALTLALMFCTEYWTSTSYSPVKSITKNSRTGDATNIIQGIAVGYESSVWAVILIALAVFAGVFIYADAKSPIFVAFGISLCGMGMLALTGDMLSMDVFGPVADNANGIGEMGYNRDTNNQPLKEGHPDYIPVAEALVARRILSDLDATGNTTKAITKGIAIGSAVVAAVSLFASFVAVLVVGSEEKINLMTPKQFNESSGSLSIAQADVFIGMLIGGAVPFLFSSMTIRAVGRAAFLIVNECRRQFADKEIWEGTKRPDYGRVVDICTSTAQKELIGPGLLAIFAPVLVGFLLGPFALGGFLAGMIVVGQLLAVFMATAGGAWDNAKKMVEDQEKSELTGKGSPQHKASVTGDTVGDPLKDTAGPAINPLIKVMNMVSLLVLPLVMTHHLGSKDKDITITATVIIVGILAIGWSWWQSKRDSQEIREMDAQYEKDIEVAIDKARQEKGKSEG